MVAGGRRRPTVGAGRSSRERRYASLVVSPFLPLNDAKPSVKVETFIYPLVALVHWSVCFIVCCAAVSVPFSQCLSVREQ